MHGNWESFFRRWMAVYGLKRQDAVQIEKTVPGVKRVLPMLTKRMNAVHGTREVDCKLIGTFPYYPEFTQAEMVVGQFLNEEEENSKVSSCVISLSLAERLFAGHNPLLETIVVRGYESSQRVCSKNEWTPKHCLNLPIHLGEPLLPTYMFRFPPLMPCMA